MDWTSSPVGYGGNFLEIKETGHAGNYSSASIVEIKKKLDSRL
jgi:hypothetical protein